MNPEKLKKLQAQAILVRIGGKGEITWINGALSDANCFVPEVCIFLRNLELTLINSSSRYTTTKEEDCSPNGRYWRQEVTINAEEARRQHDPGNRGSQHVQIRWNCHPLQQSSHSGISSKQRLRRHRTFRIENCKICRFPRVPLRRLGWLTALCLLCRSARCCPASWTTWDPKALITWSRSSWPTRMQPIVPLKTTFPTWFKTLTAKSTMRWRRHQSNSSTKRSDFPAVTYLCTFPSHL